jgi:hypothetical protein
VAAVQYTFTHKQYTEYRERDIHNNKNKWKIGKCGHGKPSVREVEKCPDIQVAGQQIVTLKIRQVLLPRSTLGLLMLGPKHEQTW